MAFKIWQIGLHLQQQEAVAVAIVRGAKECFLQRWWRLPLENDIIKDGRIVDAQQLAKTLLPWSRELPQRHHIMLAFPASRTLQRSLFPDACLRVKSYCTKDDFSCQKSGIGIAFARSGNSS